MNEQRNVNPMTEEELKAKATEHDMTDVPEIGLKATYQKIEDGVVGTYQKIEDTVVGGYKKIETGIVEGFTKVTDKFVEKLFTREGETVEEAKKRLNGENKE